MHSNTLPPGKDLIFQTIASFSGAYAAEPIDVRTFGFMASAGAGNSISTFVAVLYNLIFIKTEEKQQTAQNPEQLTTLSSNDPSPLPSP